MLGLFIIGAKKADNKKSQRAIWIAIVIHLVGLLGILFVNRYRFIVLTPINLLIMAGLLLQTRSDKNYWLHIFFVVCWIAGMAAEITGVKTGLLFGDYRYGKWLGPAFAGVPLLIGVNWFIIVYCSAAVADFILNRNKKQKPLTYGYQRKPVFLFCLIGALLATFFDWVMEPAAIDLGFWIWKGNGSIPVYNYICWFLLSFLLLFIFRKMAVTASNRFAIFLFGIQLGFFLVIRVLG